MDKKRGLALVGEARSSLQKSLSTRKRSRDRSKALDIGTIRLSRSASASLQDQLSGWFRTAILEGRLLPGAELPSSRLLAEELGVSRTTTIRTFEALVLEGLAEATVGSGTRVALHLPHQGHPLEVQAPRPIIAGGGRLTTDFAARLETLPVAGYAGTPKPFAPGIPALDQFPIAAWTKLLSQRLHRTTMAELCRSDSMGSSELRSRIAAHIGASRGARCTADTALIVTGTQQGVGLAAKVLADPGDICWIEEPGYLNARYALQMAGLRLESAPVDSNGLMVEKAIRDLPRPKLIYLTPSHQYPLGGTLSENRRQMLIDYAEAIGAWIIEDDYDSDFASAGSPIPCLQGLDRHDRVIYLGTFNKTMFPSLRLGFVIAPADLIATFRAARDYSDGHPPALMQATLADFMASGAYASHVRRLRKVYASRRQAMTDAMSTHLPQLRLGVHDRGLHFVAYLPEEADDVAYSKSAGEIGIVARPLSIFYLGSQPQKGLLLGSACVPEAEIPAGVRRLASIF